MARDQNEAKRTVKLFDASLRHGGVLTHEVPLIGVTDKEIALLRHMHGQDSVVNVKPLNKERELSEREELLRLARKYANTADPMSGALMVQKAFSVTLNEFPSWLEEQQQMEEMEREERAEKHRKDVADFTAAALSKAATDALSKAGAAAMNGQA